MDNQPNLNLENSNPATFDEPYIVEDILIETLAIDGICGVY